MNVYLTHRPTHTCIQVYTHIPVPSICIIYLWKKQTRVALSGRSIRWLRVWGEKNLLFTLPLLYLLNYERYTHYSKNKLITNKTNKQMPCSSTESRSHLYLRQPSDHLLGPSVCQLLGQQRSAHHWCECMSLMKNRRKTVRSRYTISQSWETPGLGIMGWEMAIKSGLTPFLRPLKWQVDWLSCGSNITHWLHETVWLPCTRHCSRHWRTHDTKGTCPTGLNL